jgi:LmbE family N-acetylglucosaminyl deacetylase|tara:strand:+ start:2362 stop:3183 length:822 start_codon:yes stop_codon:yes gene_type:complete
MRLLAIFAHPDDEVFSCGGTLSRYADEGYQVSLICATRGEEGEIVHPDIDSDSYPKGPKRGLLRVDELEVTCKALGITPPIFLNHQDSGFPIEVGLQNPQAFMNQDIFKIEEELLNHIGSIQPEIIITFDPHGMYGHIDHITIHRAALAAFWSAGSVMQPAPQRLYYPVKTISQVEQMQKALAGSSHSNLDPKRFGVSDDSICAEIDISDYADRKRLGIYSHRSQFGTEERIDEMLDRRPDIFKFETFVLGGARGGFPAHRLNDLFDEVGQQD